MTTPLEMRLLNEFQRDFPLAPAPFEEIARTLACDEDTVRRTLKELLEHGAISRIGAVFPPHRLGASTLAALAVPPEQVDAIARQINAYPEVNHNYEREHAYNVWFVIAAARRARMKTVLHDIARQSGYRPLYLPMIEDYHIDLGFDLHGKPPRRQHHPAQAPFTPHTLDRRLIAAIQTGIAPVSRPYREAARQAGMTEEHVIRRLKEMVQGGLIKRWGVIVRHHELGFRANAMAVWDIPDERVAALGRCISQYRFITLCYRRQRHLPDWPYNLYCMVHGRDRATVETALTKLRDECGLHDFGHQVLFSRRRFKQCGARYVESARAA